MGLDHVYAQYFENITIVLITPTLVAIFVGWCIRVGLPRHYLLVSGCLGLELFTPSQFLVVVLAWLPERMWFLFK